MKKHYKLAALFILFSGIYNVAFGHILLDTTSVLFIGNSFTNDNNCPDVFRNLANQAKSAIHVETVIHLGGSVKNYINNDTCWRTIKSRKWDYIVFQDLQSCYSDTAGIFPKDILDDNIKFQAKIKKLLPCAKIIYVAGWEKLDAFKDRFPGDNIKRLIHRIMMNYAFLNNKPNVHNIIAPVGLAWLRSLQTNHDIALYVTSDYRHPAKRGTYLYAIVIFTTIFKYSPDYNLFYSGISSKDAHLLCKCGYRAVMDTIDYTNLKTSSLKIHKMGNTWYANPFYKHYQWFKNNLPIQDAHQFSFMKPDKKSIYTAKAIDWKGCIKTSFGF